MKSKPFRRSRQSRRSSLQSFDIWAQLDHTPDKLGLPWTLGLEPDIDQSVGSSRPLEWSSELSGGRKRKALATHPRQRTPPNARSNSPCGHSPTLPQPTHLLLGSGLRCFGLPLGIKEVLVERFSFASEVAFVPRGDLLDRVTVAP